jgi:hypothetical protein
MTLLQDGVIGPGMSLRGAHIECRHADGCACASARTRLPTGGHFRDWQSPSPGRDDQIRKVAHSIFAEAAHESRSARYTYIPTIDVLKPRFLELDR